MSDRVRVGVVGTSGYVDLMHLPNLKSHTTAEVVAICGRNRARLEEIATKYAVPQQFTDYREMIARGGLDAIIVVTPHDLHYPVTMEALDAGLHVLCEKPLAMDAVQAKAMLDKAESRGLVHMTYFTWRWLPVYRHALHLVQEGFIGRWFRFEARYLAGFARGPGYSWRDDPKQSIGVLGEMGSHMIDLARLFAGEIKRVFAHLSTFVRKLDSAGKPMDAVNDSAVLLLEFASGVQGMIELSAAVHTGERDQEQHLVLHGDEGTLETDTTLTGGMAIRGARWDDRHFRVPPIPADLLGNVDYTKSLWETLPPMFLTQPIGTRHFIDAIIGGTPAVPSFLDGYRAQTVIDAAAESHARGCWIPSS